MKIVKDAPARRNVFAAALSSPSYSHRVIRNKKRYTRKSKFNRDIGR